MKAAEIIQKLGVNGQEFMVRRFLIYVHVYTGGYKLYVH